MHHTLNYYTTVILLEEPIGLTVVCNEVGIKIVNVL